MGVDCKKYRSIPHDQQIIKFQFSFKTMHRKVESNGSCGFRHTVFDISLLIQFLSPRLAYLTTNTTRFKVCYSMIADVSTDITSGHTPHLDHHSFHYDE